MVLSLGALHLIAQVHFAVPAPIYEVDITDGLDSNRLSEKGGTISPPLSNGQ
jgi:hypothetical protein